MARVGAGYDVEYYDWLLAAMAAAVLLGAAVSVHSAVTLSTGVKAGGAVATAFLYQALFRRPPQVGANRETASVVVWHCLFLGQFLVW